MAKAQTFKSNSIKLKEQQTEKDTEAANVASPETSVPTYRRSLSGMKQIFTDLFKLCVASVTKYEGWDEANEHPDTHPSRFSHWEHSHPFRTYDKKGSKMNTCTPIAGHFHVIEWDESKSDDEPPRIKSVSGPMVMKTVRKRGKLVKEPTPANDYDFHTHDVEYLRSCKVEVSTTNIEATKVIAYEAQKTAPIAGVEVR
jgi:hypothetical protein